jgi:hypothetical protein
MSATSQISSIDAIGIPPLRSSLAYLFQGNTLTAAFLKIKALLFKSRPERGAPDPGDREDPLQSTHPEDYWTDPMMWSVMFH